MLRFSFSCNVQMCAASQECYFEKCQLLHACMHAAVVQVR